MDEQVLVSFRHQKLQIDFEILQRIDLKPFDKDHAMIIARSLN